MLVAITKKEEEGVVAHFNANLIKIAERYGNFVIRVFEKKEIEFLKT